MRPVALGRLTIALVVGLGVGGACSDRSLDDPPDLDIEGLCHEYCARVMECRWRPDSNAAFDTAAECEDNCRNDLVWDTTCDVVQADKFECYVSYDCPEFATLGTDLPGGRCHDEYFAWSACVPGDPR